MLRNEAVQEWSEACQTDSLKPKIPGAWRDSRYERFDFELPW